MAHKMPTTHVGCYRPAVLDGGSNPPISTSCVTARHCKLHVAGRLCSAGFHKTCAKVASFLLYQRGQAGVVPIWHGGVSLTCPPQTGPQIMRVLEVGATPRGGQHAWQPVYPGADSSAS